MAVYPGARARLIAPGGNDPRITVIGAILHVDAGNSKSLYGYFDGPSGGIESHFHIPKEGLPEQYRDTAFEADANYHGNSFRGADGRLYGYVSIETQGFVDGEWNAHQLSEIKKLLVWLSKTHNFPLVKCPAHEEPGVGYHILFGAPGPWTPVAKECPGPARIRQFDNVLVPWFKTATQEEEEDMQFTDPIPGVKDADGSPLTVGEALLRGAKGYTYVIEGGPLEDRVSTLEARVDSNTDAHADYAYGAVTEGGVVVEAIQALRAALASLPDSTGSKDDERLDALEAFVAKLKGALL